MRIPPIMSRIPFLGKAENKKVEEKKNEEASYVSSKKEEAIKLTPEQWKELITRPQTYRKEEGKKNGK